MTTTATDLTLAPLRPDDAEAASALAERVWRAYDVAHHRPMRPEATAEEVAESVEGFARHAGREPEGAHAAWDDGRLVGVALARWRERLWGLSLLIVDPDAQGRGVGARLLEAALAGGADAELAMIVSSEDPRAMARYRLAGFELHPTLKATGRLAEEARAPVDGARDGDAGDLGWIDELGRSLRGARYGPDLAELAERARLVVVERGGARGWAFVREAGVVQAGATDPATARAVLRAALAATAPSEHDIAVGEEARVRLLSAAQGWAVDVAIAAGLRLSPGPPLCLRGVAPPTPYLPHGLVF